MRLSCCFLIIALALSGCGLLPSKADKTKNWSAKKLYTNAKALLDDGDYQAAIGRFDKLEARYPFGPYSQQAQLEIAYAYYKYGEPDSALAAAQRFIKTNPKHPDVAYAYYLQGLINYHRGHSLVDRFIPRDLSERDPEYSRKAFYDFQKVVKDYPNSRYAADARQRMLYLRNIMAKYEINVADYYMRRGAYLAAADRAQYVLKHYERTAAVPQALVITIKAYRKLKLPKLAADAQHVLELNFPKKAAAVGAAEAD